MFPESKNIHSQKEKNEVAVTCTVCKCDAMYAVSVRLYHHAISIIWFDLKRQMQHMQHVQDHPADGIVAKNSWDNWSLKLHCQYHNMHNQNDIVCISKPLS